MPHERVPTAQLYALPEFRERLDALTGDVLRHNPVLRGKLNGFVRQAAQASDVPEETAGEIRRAFFKTVRREAVETLRDDAGYNEEMRRTTASGVLQTIFRLLSQMSAQKQAQGRQFDLHRKTLLQKSKEERKNTRAKMRQRGHWSRDFDGIEQ